METSQTLILSQLYRLTVEAETKTLPNLFIYDQNVRLLALDACRLRAQVPVFDCDQISDGCKGTDRAIEPPSDQTAFTFFSAATKAEWSEMSGASRALSEIAQIIRAGVANKIVVMSGAGLSTASGLPDFRSPGSGLYDNLGKYNLPYPTAVFDIGFFQQNPVPFFQVAKELYPGNYPPNEGHFLVRLLSDKRLLLRNYTQNIDGLETRGARSIASASIFGCMAGIPQRKLVEAHGSFSTATCRGCGLKYTSEEIKDAIFNDQVPKCKKCTDIVKPDIVFFGEMMPDRFMMHAVDLPFADLLIVMGTSLEVEPFASIAGETERSVPRLLINRDLVGSFLMDPRQKDHFHQGDIVAAVRQLCKELNWEQELDELKHCYHHDRKKWNRLLDEQDQSVEE